MFIDSNLLHEPPPPLHTALGAGLPFDTQYSYFTVPDVARLPAASRTSDLRTRKVPTGSASAAGARPVGVSFRKDIAYEPIAAAAAFSVATSSGAVTGATGDCSEQATSANAVANKATDQIRF